jgi:hypothetical protein
MVRLIEEVHHDTVAGGCVFLNVHHQLSPVQHPLVGIVLDGGVFRVIVNQHVHVVACQELHRSQQLSHEQGMTHDAAKGVGGGGGYLLYPAENSDHGMQVHGGAECGNRDKKEG